MHLTSSSPYAAFLPSIRCRVSADDKGDAAAADANTYCPSYAATIETVAPSPDARPWRVVGGNRSDTAASASSTSTVTAGSGGLNGTRGAVELRVGGGGAFNRTSLRTQLGVTASLVAGATYRLSAWVRCGSSADNVTAAATAAVSALDASVVASVRLEALPSITEFSYSTSSTSRNGLPLYRPVPVVGSSAAARATLNAPCNASGATQRERGSEWRELSVTFTVSRTVRDTSATIRVQSASVNGTKSGGGGDVGKEAAFSGWVRFDNVTLTRVTPAPGAGKMCNVDGDADDSWPCMHVAENFYNVLRERYGVPVSTPQFSYLINGPLNDAITFVPFRGKDSNVRIGDYVGPPPCASLVGARVPGLTEQSVIDAMAKVSDASLIAGLGWDPASAADGGFEAANVAGAVQSLRANIHTTIKAGIFRPFSGPTVGASPWQPAHAAVRFPDSPVQVLEGIVNVYLSSKNNADDDLTSTSSCALDREQWEPTLCYAHAWFANVLSSNRLFRGTELPVNANGEHFSVAWTGEKAHFTSEQTAANQNWFWIASRLSPATFGGLVGGGLAALGSPALGNMTMRGLLPCDEYFVKVVQAISKMPYPCNTMLGFNEPFAAEGYIKLILQSHAKTVGGLCVNTLDYAEGQKLAAEVWAKNASRGGNLTAGIESYEEDEKDPVWNGPIGITVIIICAVAIALASAHFIRKLWMRTRENAADLKFVTIFDGGNPHHSNTSSDKSTGVNTADKLVVVEFDHGEKSSSDGNSEEGSKLITHSRMELKECIAHGGEGVVYLGNLGKKLVAVKLLHSLKDAEHEINIFKHLPNHPNLVKLLGYTNLKSRWSLVMEYCNYRCLHHCLSTGIFFDLPDEVKGGVKKGDLVVKILQDILTGLSVIHEAKTYHNDMKMENVMITCADPAHHAKSPCDCLRQLRLDNICVKISDLGMSKTNTYAAYSSGNLEGTVCYIPADRTNMSEAVSSLSKMYIKEHAMSPAEAKQKSYENVYELCDIYAFSMLAWELMVSTYQGYEVRVTSSGQICEHSQIAMYMPGKGNRPDVSEANGFHPSLAKVLHGWWAEDITKRTASAIEARRELGGVVSHVLRMAQRTKKEITVSCA